MLSLVDLLRAGTVNPDLAAYLAAAVSRGASFLVGALPGGAGKTTAMGALLNFVPPEVQLAPADSAATVRRAIKQPSGDSYCYICHEIGNGPYYAYLWGQAARDFFALPGAGHTIATNLHADTFEQCRDQLCIDNGVTPDDFRRCRLCLFIHQVGSGWFEAQRRIVTVWESDGERPHCCLWQWDSGADAFRQLEESSLVPKDDLYVWQMHDLLMKMDAEDVCTIADVRRRFVEFAENRTWRRDAAGS